MDCSYSCSEKKKSFIEIAMGFSGQVPLRNLNSAPGQWGRTQMGSDGFNRILTGLYFFSPVGVRRIWIKSG